MNEASSFPLPHPSSRDSETTPEKPEGVQWEEVATTVGITAAQIMVGRLRSEGIPARAWQEGAGQAIGLIVGPLGAGHVVVPQEFAVRALEILSDVDDDFAEGDEESFVES